MSKPNSVAEAPTVLSSLSSHDPLISRKLYKRRWIVLFLFLINAMFLNPHISMYTIISHITKDYYNASLEEINMSSNISQIVAVIFFIPGAWILDKTNLRFVCLMYFLLTSIGAWIKVVAVDPSLFWLVMCGQVLISIGYTFNSTIPPRLATVWFGQNEVSTACAMLYFGITTGLELEFLVVPRVVTENSDIEITKSQLYRLTMGLAVINTSLFVLLISYFPAAPPTPPNNAVVDHVPTTKEFFMSLNNLMTQSRYICFMLGTLFHYGALDLFYNVIDEVINENFEGEKLMSSTAASIYMGVGTVCTLLYGIILDRTKKFRELLWTLLVIACVCLISFPFVYQTKSVIAVYVAAFIYGATGLGITPVWFENIVELTYPEKEFTSCGLINTASFIGAFIMNLVFTTLLSNFGSFWANIYVGCSSLIGVLFMSQIGRRLRRQEAFNS